MSVISGYAFESLFLFSATVRLHNFVSDRGIYIGSFFFHCEDMEKKLRTKRLSLCVALVKISASLYRVNSRAYLLYDYR